MERMLNLDELETVLYPASTIIVGALKEREEKLNAIAKQSDIARATDSYWTADIDLIDDWLKILVYLGPVLASEPTEVTICTF